MSMRLFLVITIYATIGSAAGRLLVYGPQYLIGDSRYYAYTCESLLHDGDFDLTNNLTGSNEITPAARETLRGHEGFFALSPAGRIVPKHSTLMPILSVPFVAVFGTTGFLIFNVIVVVFLVLCVAKLAGDTPAARVLALALFVTSSWFSYSFNYSPDLFVTLLITAAFLAARHERWLLCGLLAGLAVWAKVYAFIILAPLAILILPAGRKAVTNVILGSGFGLVPMLMINDALYGGPLVTGYDRDAWLTADGFRVREHYSLFHQPFFTGLVRLLINFDAGMIRTAPLWFFWPVGLLMHLKSPTVMSKKFAMALALASMFNVLLFAPYDEWNASTGGNRFLFPAVALGCALLEPCVQWILARFATRIPLKVH